MNQPAPQMDPDAAAAMIAGILFVMALALIIGLAINVIICLLLHKSLSRLPQECRQLDPPGLVWLLLIPFFNYIWNFFVFLRIPESYQRYFAMQGRGEEFGDCGRTLGMWFACLSAGSFLGSFVPFVNCLSAVAGLASLIVLIIFLVKVWGLRGEVPEGAPPDPIMA